MHELKVWHSGTAFVYHLRVLVSSPRAGKKLKAADTVWSEYLYACDSSTVEAGTWGPWDEPGLDSDTLSQSYLQLERMARWTRRHNINESKKSMACQTNKKTWKIISKYGAGSERKIVSTDS